MFTIHYDYDGKHLASIPYGNLLISFAASLEPFGCTLLERLEERDGSNTFAFARSKRGVRLIWAEVQRRWKADPRLRHAMKRAIPASGFIDLLFCLDRLNSLAGLNPQDSGAMHHEVYH